MRIIQIKLTLTALISTTLLVSIGLSSSVAGIDSQNNCTSCIDIQCPDCSKKCPGDCPDGYGESIDSDSETICVTNTNSTPSETKTCHKCRVESCKSCNVSMSGNVHMCFQCLDNFTLQNNTCTNHTSGGKDDTDNGALIGGVIGGVLGGTVVITLIVLGSIYLRHRRRQGERIIERGSGNEMSDKITQSTENDTRSKSEVHLQMPKTEDIQRAHDHVTRYTKDPTEHVRSMGLSQRSETAELEDLGLAPPPPSESYDFPDPANCDDPQSYSPVLPRKHPEPVEDNDDEMYINNASLRETDSTYGNASVFQPEYDFPDAPKSNMPAPLGAKDEPSTVVGCSEMVDDESQEIYLNEYVDSPTAALVSEDEEGPQEIYMNENLDNDDIYQNMVQ